jgi:cytosine/adenosine deaminase-related metal-dependent hydrolase
LGYFDLLVIRNGLLVTMNAQAQILEADIVVEDNIITDICTPSAYADDVTIFDAHGFIVLPGFIQTHVHLCQTLFRNLADDVTLMQWLQDKIWPLEGGLTPESLRLSAQLGISELLLSGTTTIMDMGTVHYMDVVFEEIERSGIRAFCGKTMMDDGTIPVSLRESTTTAIDSSLQLLERWHNRANERIKYAFAPRFLLTCSADLITETAKYAENYNIPFHSHASETKYEVEHIRNLFGVGNIEYFAQLGAAQGNLCLAHCIWPTENDKKILIDYGVNVLHCPSSNLKLGSGIAPIPDYIDQGINVSIGADGAPCNNNLNIFQEMRLASLIQKPIHGPQVLNAEQVVRMATINGARTLGIDHQTGSIDKGKKADLIFIKSDQIQTIPFDNIYAKIVYSTNQDAVTHVMIDGQWLVTDRVLLREDVEDLKIKINTISRQIIN